MPNQGLNFFKASGNESNELLYVLLGLALLVMLICFIVYRYKRFKMFQEFTQEMTLLDFDEVQESTLTNIVKRYALREPVSVLFSLQLFDELATKEISRILGSPGSVMQKQNFINMVYEIRRRTYFQELSAPKVQAEEMASETA